ncbi:MAG: UPF0182 family protein [Candidatus Hodarchaeota archaeon]
MVEYGQRRIIRIGGRRQRFLIGSIILIVIILVVVAGIFGIQNMFLDWKMLDAMYLNKAGVSWWATYSLNGLLFFVGVPAALIITLAGMPHESKVLNLIWMNERISSRRYPKWYIVVGYKFLLFILSYVLFTFVFIENARYLALLFQSSASGVGNWGQIGDALTLIFNPMVSVDVVANLVATIEVQYSIFLIYMSLMLLVIGIRVVLDLVHYFARIGPSTRRPEVRVIASISFLAVLVLLWFLLTVPYMRVDVGTQFYVFQLLILFIFSSAVCVITFGLTIIGRFGRAGEVPRVNRRVLAGLGIITAILIILPAVFTGYLVAGPIQGQMWEPWHWDPLVTKEIEFTNWAGGPNISEIPYQSLVNNTGVSDGQVLGHARLWDLTASRNKMRSQTIANWMALADSDVVYLGGREYWIAPYSLAPPTREDFHNRYLLYTHAEGATVLDASSATGEFLTPSQVQSIFSVEANFPIYYGESPPEYFNDGFEGFVLVDTNIAPETGTHSFEGEPDYILSGAELALKKLIWSIEDLSFAWLSFNEPVAKVLMLRNAEERVQSILLPFMYTDWDPYLVFDRANREAYYCVPVYSAYPLQLQYAQSPYLRLLGFALVHCENGDITWVRNPNANPAEFFIESLYENWYPWIDSPAWLIDQLRYPEDLINAQLAVDFYYHVTQPWVWRANADFFEKPDSQPSVHYVLYPYNGSLHWVGYQAARYVRHEAMKMAGFYLFKNGPEVGTGVFARAGTIDPDTATPISPVFGVDAAVESFEQQARSDLVLIQPYRIGNRLLMPLSGRLVYLFPVYAEQPGDSLVETLTYVGMVDAEDINQVAYAPTVAEAYAKFFFGYNQTVTGVDFIETSLNPFDIDVGDFAEISYLVKNGNTTSSDVSIQLAMHTSNFDVYFHSSNVTPIIQGGLNVYNISQLLMYPQDVSGGTITVHAKALDAGMLLATYIIELRILVNNVHTQTEYFYLTVRST